MMSALVVSRVLATWFGIGLLPFAPGTWAALSALPLAYGLVRLGGVWALSAATAAVVVAGLWASGRVEADMGVKDPGPVVIDEVAGQWLALIPVALDWRLWPIAFVVFRIADIGKPWPVSWAEQSLPGATGIMVDDLLAGAYAALAAWLVGRWIAQ